MNAFGAGADGTLMRPASTQPPARLYIRPRPAPLVVPSMAQLEGGRSVHFYGHHNGSRTMPLAKTRGAALPPLRSRYHSLISQGR